MADIKTIYFDLIKDLYPFDDMDEHKNLTLSDMLYNLIEILNNNFDDKDRDYYRVNTLIDLFISLGIEP